MKPSHKEAPAPIGDNSALTEEQEARALRIYHVSKLREQMQKVKAAQALLDAARQVFTDLCHVAKADTHIQRKEFTALLKAMDMSKDELREEEERRALLWGDWDLPVGHQGDLFENLPREARDEQYAKGMGYAAGLRGDPCQMPDGMEVRFSAAFGAGWGKGQEELAWALSAVGVITDRRKGVATGPTAAEIAAQPEEDEDEETIEQTAARLKAEGFTERTPEPV